MGAVSGSAGQIVTIEVAGTTLRVHDQCNH